MALVIAPTRELAMQVQRELVWLYRRNRRPRRDLRRWHGCPRGEPATSRNGAHIVVGTPGRLRDHLERQRLDLSTLKTIVLDEADEMLDLGFREDLEFILDATPPTRQTLLFSATMPREIENLARRYQRDAIRIDPTRGNEQHIDIEYRAIRVAPFDIENAVVNVLRLQEARAAIVFCATRESVKRMHARLVERGFAAVALSGELTQNERTTRSRPFATAAPAFSSPPTSPRADWISPPSPSSFTPIFRTTPKRCCTAPVAPDAPARRASAFSSCRSTAAARPDVAPCWRKAEGHLGHRAHRGRDPRARPGTLPHRKHLHRCRNAGRNTARRSVEGCPQRRRDRARSCSHPSLAPCPRPRISPRIADHRSATTAALQAGIASRVPSATTVKSAIASRGLRQLAPREPSRSPRPLRDDGREMVWFTLSIGRERNADPRWLLPIICRAGNVTKSEIGAIRIQDNETRF